MLKKFRRLSRVALMFSALISASFALPAARADLFSSTVYAVQTLEDKSERTTSIAFSPNANLIAWATSDEKQGQLFWGYDNYGLKWTKVVDLNADGALVAFSADSARLAVASPLSKAKKGASATLEIFSTDLDSRLPQHIVQVPASLWKIAPKYSVTQIAFSPDNTTLAGICNDRAVRIWKVADGKVLQTLNIAREAQALAFAADGKLIVATGAKSKGELQWWNPTTAKMMRKIEVGAAYEALFLADEGETVVSSDATGIVTFWNAASGAKIRTVTMESSASRLQALSPDGAWLAGFVTGENPSDLVLAQWNADGVLRLSYPGNRGPQRPVAFASDTRHIATGGVGGEAENVDHAMLNVWPVNQ